MKSSFYFLFLGILVASMVLPVVTLAVPITGPVDGCKLVQSITYNGQTLSGPITSATTSDWGVFCFLNMMNIVINIIFIGLMILVIVMVMMGAFKLMTAAGAPDKVSAGRNMIMYAAIGLIVALVAKAVPSIVSTLFG